MIDLSQRLGRLDEALRDPLSEGHFGAQQRDVNQTIVARVAGAVELVGIARFNELAQLIRIVEQVA